MVREFVLGGGGTVVDERRETYGEILLVLDRQFKG